MKCKNCGKEIQENEVFCNNCKNQLNSISSKDKVNELEDLIEDQKKLNDLEITKELFDLNKFVVEEPKNDLVVDENIEQHNSQRLVGDFKSDDINEALQNNNYNKKNKKKIIIITSIVVIIIVIVIFIVMLLMSLTSTKNQNNSETKNKVVIDYNKVINEYGKSLENTIKKYISLNENVPNWQQTSELNTYKKYEVICETHDIYSDGSIYLSSCTVNNKYTKYTYGIKKEEIKEGKKINIYKLYYSNDSYSYFNNNSNGANLVATITCKTEDCDYVNAYDKYVLIRENNEYYLYNYENDSIEFGPFKMKNRYSYLNTLLTYDNKLYAIYYNEDNIDNIYNVITGKILKNIKGELMLASASLSPNVMYKYNYAIFISNNQYNFVNLKSGNVSYTISNKIGSFIEDEKNNIVYITSYDNSIDQFKIYNSNGKLLFNGEVYSFINVADGNLMVASIDEFKIYDSKLKLKISSKKYDKVLGLYESFIVVIDNNNLKIIDLNDRELANFKFEWNDNKHYFHSELSGLFKGDGKNGIYLVVENKDIPYGTKGSGLEYFYIPATGETGVIETNGVKKQ